MQLNSWTWTEILLTVDRREDCKEREVTIVDSKSANLNDISRWLMIGMDCVIALRTQTLGPTRFIYDFWNYQPL